ncbi:YraN family protein [Phaeobacter sp.]|uniref:YraN family protein n=1 Tax=Phaeobacter sp. TaxID=1902409 RepID=UPI0025CC3DA5|nr:YraN family protein [Phaeobacter sp.]
MAAGRGSSPGPRTARQRRGAQAHHAGSAAEELVARHYERAGYAIAARRWRGGGAEIDLILRQGATVIFVEVKHSRSFDAAAARITPAQMERMMQSAARFLEGEPNGALTECRLDIALVDGTGRVEILPNAYGQG